MGAAEETVGFSDGVIIAVGGRGEGMVEKLLNVWCKVEILREGFCGETCKPRLASFPKS